MFDKVFPLKHWTFRGKMYKCMGLCGKKIKAIMKR
jgi:hypothetical protein